MAKTKAKNTDNLEKNKKQDFRSRDYKGYGIGSVYQKRDKNGVPYGKFYATKMINGKRRSVSGKTKAEVQKKIVALLIELSNSELQRQKLEEIKQEEIQKNSEELLKSYIYRWAKIYKSTLRSQKSVFCVIRRICRFRIAKLALKDIKVEDIQTFLNDMTAKKLSLRTQEYTFVMLNDCLNSALDNDYIQKNPCQNSSIKKPHPVKKQIKKFWTEEECEQFIKAYEGKHPLFNLFYLMLLTGARKQEICALKWNDVDWKTKTLRIDSAIVVSNDKGEEEGPVKRPSSEGIIGLPEIALELLRKQRKDQLQQGLKYKWQNVGNWIFTSMYGKHYSLSWPTQCFKKMCADIGLKHITVHGLRHTHATLLYQHGITIEDIARRLRHSTSQITSQLYVHDTDETIQRPAVAVDDIFGKKEKAPKQSEAN